MAGSVPPKRNFADVLDAGAKVDDIFKDSPAPLGSDPFAAQDGVPTITPLSVEEVRHSPTPGQPKTETEGEPGEEQSIDFDQVAIADNDSLFCLNRKFDAIQALFKLITKDFYSFGQLISEILRVAMERVESEAGSFIEIDYENKHMFFRAVTGRSSENLLNFTIPAGQGIAGFVCENQQPIALSNVDDSSVYLRSISTAVGFETRNMLAYPVIIRGVTFGCIELLNRLTEPHFTDADKEVMATISEYASKVVENRLILAALSKQLVGTKQTKTEEDAA